MESIDADKDILISARKAAKEIVNQLGDMTAIGIGWFILNASRYIKTGVDGEVHSLEEIFSAMDEDDDVVDCWNEALKKYVNWDYYEGEFETDSEVYENGSDDFQASCEVAEEIADRYFNRFDYDSYDSQDEPSGDEIMGGATSEFWEKLAKLLMRAAQ